MQDQILASNTEQGAQTWSVVSLPKGQDIFQFASKGIWKLGPQGCNLVAEESRWSVNLESMKGEEDVLNQGVLKKWLSVTVLGYYIGRSLWGFVQCLITLGHHCCPLWSKNVAIHVLKLIHVARVNSKAEFRLLFWGQKRFASDMNGHVLS